MIHFGESGVQSKVWVSSRIHEPWPLGAFFLGDSFQPFSSLHQDQFSAAEGWMLMGAFNARIPCFPLCSIH